MLACHIRLRSRCDPRLLLVCLARAKSQLIPRAEEGQRRCWPNAVLRLGPGAGDGSSRGRLQPLQAVQSSANAGPVPFGTEWRWYLALVQLVRDSLDGQARLAKLMNCLAQGLGSQVRGPLESQSIIAVTGLDQPKTYQHPGYGGAMPITAVGGWNPLRFNSSLRPAWEACSHKLSNGRRQSSGAGVRGLLERQRTVPPAPARRRLPTCSLHRAIMAGP